MAARQIQSAGYHPASGQVAVTHIPTAMPGIVCRESKPMGLLSALPSDTTPARRLHEFAALVRELSLQRDARQLLNTYRARSQYVIAWDHMLSLSRRYSAGDEVRITRSSRFAESIDPWRDAHRLPVIRSGLAHRLMYAATPVKIDELDVPPDDPAVEHFEGMRSLLASPVYHEGQPLYMTMLMREQPGSFSIDDLTTLVLTSNLVGLSTTNLISAADVRSAYNALEREFRQVGQLQRDLLPRELPMLPGVTVAAHYETSTQAGGDYYDFVRLSDGRLGVMIADVSGHGSPAAVVTAMIHALMNSFGDACGVEPSQPVRVLEALNRNLLRSMRAGQFATAFYGVLDPRTRTFEFATAGHNPPRLMRRATRSIQPLWATPALPLAISDTFEAEQASIRFEPGDRLLLYTDGVTETFNERREMFGVEGLDAALTCCSRTPTSILDAVRGALASFSSAPPADDRTLLVIAFD
ncbi:MAG: PP2C family protein-serine/threonine phosphatase [Phycisphaerae bacterium]